MLTYSGYIAGRAHLQLPFLLSMQKADISRALLQSGLTIRPPALDALVVYLNTLGVSAVNGDEFEVVQEKLAKCDVIDVSDIAGLYDQPQHQGKDWLISLNVTQDLPHYVYSPDEGEFKSVPLSAVPLDDFSSINMMQERLFTVRAILKTNKLFEANERIYGPKETRIELITVDALVGSINEKVVLGMLNRVDEVTWTLEDLTGSVKVDLSQLEQPIYGYYPSGCIVLMQGEYQDGLFSARAMMHPPASSSYRAKVDLFGAEKWRELGKEEAGKAVKLDTRVEKVRIVVIADVHLDDYHTMDKLRALFFGYRVRSHFIFLLIGDFLSRPSFEAAPYRQAFTALEVLISEFQTLRENCHWVIIPGPNDVGLGTISPRDALPDLFTEPLHKLNHFMSASNPCRLEVCGVKVVAFSTDLVRKMRRNSAVQPTNDLQCSDHLFHTLLHQAHLTPGRDHNSIWELDHTLRLLPLPDVLIYHDKCEQFVQLKEDCLVLNPASFTHDSTFLFVTPGEKKADECKLPELEVE